MKVSAGSMSGKSSLNTVAAATVIVGVLVVGLGSYDANIGLAALAALTLVIGVVALWRPGEAPTLLFIFVYQWLQASTAIFQASFDSKSLDDFYGTGRAADATALTLIALSLMAIGMRVGLGRARRDIQHDARVFALTVPMRTWFALYLISRVVAAGATFAGRIAPGISQITLAIAALSWAFFFILAVAQFSRARKAGWWFPAAFLFELAMSVGGYFSDFRTVFVVTMLATLMAGVGLTFRKVVAAVVVAVAALGLGVVWTAVKPEYRQFASGGVSAQIVTVGYPERIQKLRQLVSDLDSRALGDATQQLLSRLSYVEYFGSVLSYVPSSVPHENGALLLDAVIRPITPRMLFPNKPEIDDSLRTQIYTGRSVAGANQGTSISLGWVAEMYIDFGGWGMMVAAIALGSFYGLIGRFLTTWKWSRGLLGFAIAVAVLIPAAPLESSITKVIGGLIASILASIIVVRFVVPQWCPWLLGARK